MSNNPRNIIEQNVYTPAPGEAQGVWKPWEDLQAMYTNTWPGSNAPVPVEYFVVSGGGNSGPWQPFQTSAAIGGVGGGAGGIITGSSNVNRNISTTVIVGAGAAKSLALSNGSTSTFGTFTSPAASSFSSGGSFGAGGAGSAGAGGAAGSGTQGAGGGGGDGGLGTTLSWEATSVTVAGGGGGGGLGGGGGPSFGGRGNGGGAAGRNSIDTALGVISPNLGNAGTANTGGGGGGAGGYYNQGGGSYWNQSANSTGAGGSGVVWIRYPQFYLPAVSTTNVAAGYPVINNGYRIYKWITSGAITF